MELHCPVVCLTEDNSRVLVAQRNYIRKVYPGKLEFGAAKPHGYEKMEETITKEYFEDFGLAINLIKDEDNNLIPFATYEVKRDGELHKGIVFAAHLNKYAAPMYTRKHLSAHLLPIEQILEMDENLFVPGLQKNVKKVLEYVNKK